MAHPPQVDNQADAIVQHLQQELPRLRQEYDVDRLALFGSVARNEQREDSDVDILVSFRVVPGLLKYIALEQHLTDVLRKPVDLVMEGALKPDIAAHVQADIRWI